jgi:transcriptional regulator with XRE-family HTH domain
MKNDIAIELREDFQDKAYAQAYAEDFLNAAIATQIKVLREDRGLTQSQLADLAGMKQSRISVMEDVNYGSWNLKTLLRLAAAFDVALNVSFESFGKVIRDATSFSRTALGRPSRLDSLSSEAGLASEVRLPSIQNSGLDANPPKAASAFFLSRSAADALSPVGSRPPTSVLDGIYLRRENESRASVLGQWKSNARRATSSAFGAAQ